MAMASNISSNADHFTYVALKIAIVQCFDRKGLCQVPKSERENSSCIPNNDLHGRNVVMLQFIVLHDMLNITTDMSIMLPVVHIVSLI